MIEEEEEMNTFANQIPPAPQRRVDMTPHWMKKE